MDVKCSLYIVFFIVCCVTSDPLGKCPITQFELRTPACIPDCTIPQCEEGELKVSDVAIMQALSLISHAMTYEIYCKICFI